MNDNLKDRTAKGVLWGLINQGSMQMLNVVFGIVLGNLLMPGDYGIVGVLTVFTLIANQLQQFGFTQGLINLRDAQHRDYNSVFWFNILISLSIYAVLFVSAPLIAHFFKEPALVDVSRFLFLGFLIASTGIVPGAYMTKHLMVKQQAIIGLVALLCSGATGIALALQGYGYWALAWQQVIYVVVSQVGKYVVAPFRPTLPVTFEPVRRMFRFSINIMFTNFVSILSQQMLTFIFGRMLPMHQVGNYSQANKWSLTASDTVRMALYGVAQPVMAEVRDDPTRTRRVLRKLMRLASFMAFPAMFCLALVAGEFILGTIGTRWVGCITVLSLLAVGSSVLPHILLMQNMFIAHGRSGLYLRLTLLQVALQLTLALLIIPYGMSYTVLALGALNACYLLLLPLFARPIMGYTLGDLLRDILPYAFAAATAVGITYYTTTTAIDIFQLASTSRIFYLSLLAVRGLLVVILYGLILLLMRDEILGEVIAYLTRKTSKPCHS